MKSSRHIHAMGSALLAAAVVAFPAWGYSPKGPVPEAPKTGETRLWTDQDVDRVVDVRYVSVDAFDPVSNQGAPAACDKVSFLRFKAKRASDNAEDADALLLMVPGILEGANGFDFIGRQMVYLARKEYGKNIEVWAMDRRANCLEDLIGMHQAEDATTASAAAAVLTGYYYDHQAINGKTFDGFLTSEQLPFLYDFGMRQTTRDMFAIIQHMVPHAAVRKRKVFVGGHSLGGLHTSVFLSWDLDGNPATTGDAGYNWVAGAFGFDTFVSPLGQMNAASVSRLMPEIAGALPLAGSDERSYRKKLEALKSGETSRDVFVPGVFGPEIIALPQAVGLLADKDPDGESTVLPTIPKSPELSGMLKLLHSRNLYNLNHPPFIEDFRYTNQAFVGLIFDDNFSPLSFLQAGLGFLHGGAVVRKQKGFDLLEAIPGVGPLITGFYGTQPHYIAADAGPDLAHLGQGPLYDWVRRDQVGTQKNPGYLSTNGKVQYTYLVNEPSDIRDFTRALHEGPTNLTEWYFPTRIVIDSAAVSADYATRYGLDVYYPDGVTQVPSILIEGEQGLSGYKVGDPPPFPQQLIVAPGFTHLDPMFESVNSPSQNDYVMRPLIEFALAHAH